MSEDRTLAQNARMNAIPVKVTEKAENVENGEGPVEVRTRSGRVIGYVAAKDSHLWDAYR